MKKYNYKIQWLLNANQLNKGKVLKQLIDILGVKSLDKIVFRDLDLNIIDEYNGFIMFPCGVAEDETLKYVKKQLKKNEKIHYVEVLRK